MADTKLRSFVKSVVWRILGVITLGTISLVCTGSWKAVGWITGIFTAIRIVMYYYHERIWQKIKWGQNE